MALELLIRRMAVSDIPFGMMLKEQNRWNQTEADWQRQLDLEPEGCFVAEKSGQAAGTACACIFANVAWINLVLVERALRGQGIGTALMQQVIDHLDRLGVPSIRLDATPLGQPVYAKLGFVEEFPLLRYHGVLPPVPADEADADMQPATVADLDDICRLDETVTGTRRMKLLRHLLGSSSGITRKLVVDGRLQGYYLARPGAHAWKIGPVQGPPELGRRVLQDAVRHCAGRAVYLDVPIANTAAIASARDLGLTVQRQLLRMGRGPRVKEDLSWFWSSFGPEKG